MTPPWIGPVGPVGDVDRRVVYATSTPAQRAELDGAAGSVDWAPTVAQVRAVLARAHQLQAETPLSTRSLPDTVRLLRDVAAGQIARGVVEHGMQPSQSESDWFRSVSWVDEAVARRLARLRGGWAVAS